MFNIQKNKLILIKGIKIPWYRRKIKSKSIFDSFANKLHKEGLPIRKFYFKDVSIRGAWLDSTRCKIANHLIKQLPDDGDIAIAWSYGSVVVHTACLLGAKFDTIVLFGAALGNDLSWPEGCAKRIINIYNPKEWVLMLGSLLPHHPFGSLGRTGYKGVPDKRIQEIYADLVHTKKSWFRQHSDYFKEPNSDIWIRLIKRLTGEKKR